MRLKSYLREMATDLEREIATKTARAAGAVGAKAIVPIIVRQEANKDRDVILDFGAGKASLHALMLKDEGYNVTAFDFSPGPFNDATALSRKYTLVYASNVLNVQSSEDMLMNDTLDIVYDVLRSDGKFIANLPSNPLKGLYTGLTYKESIKLIDDKLNQVFNTVKRVSGSTPVWICTK